MRVGSLCTGIAGLDHGLHLAGVDVEPVFVSDIDPGACDWLAANMPDVPNLGDFTALDSLPEVDLLTAGFPCQPVSTAGKRAGIEDERWLFDDIARLVSRMESRPVVFLENVLGLLTANDGDAMARVVYGLAAIGYHITWGTLSATAVGAPHRRLRWWGLAYPQDADREPCDERRLAASRQTESGRARPDTGRRDRAPAADADRAGSETRLNTRSRSERPRLQPVGSPTSAADADSIATRRHSRTTPSPQEQARRQPHSGHGPRNGDRHARFGPYAHAVDRWEHILGRAAPDPTDDGRLNAAFVEWMMGYPEGWVTDTLTRRTQSLHALGNAVVPQCAAAAFTQLANRLTT